MDENSIILLAIVLSIAVILLSFALAFWLLTRLRRKSDQPLSHETDGVVVVPVRRLARSFGFFGHSENSLSPRFEITREGLRFKVFKVDHWPFATIAGVDAPRVPFATRLAFKADNGHRLFVDVADRAKARDLLNALPPGLNFSDAAIRMRESVA